ncbi:MAG: DHA2 family efflux MFS transporter permease subunit [Desulfovibrionaceae bacterium]|nr:DHA2 family efflux MFS transporter permease subunit [Desulfovibrionaceae bacterium]
MSNAHPPLQGLPLLLLTVALPLATFMQVLDSTIANVAVPTLAGNLGASTTQGTWVITSYAVANAISLPITGWLARRFGEVRLFLWSTGLFVFASFLCGMAPSLTLLVLFRVLQGAVSGPMLPLAQTLLLNNYPPAKRNMAIALWSMTVSVAPIFGPVLGGFISDNYHWGWIFFINVPVGALVVVLVWRLLRDRESARRRQPLNVVGLSLLVLGVGALQMMLDRGKELDWFNSTQIITLAVIALVGLTFLVAWELTDANPIIDLRLFASRNFSIGVICISLGMMLFIGTVVLLPLLLQTQYGYTATLAGLAAAPIGILPVLLAPLIGKHALRLIDLRILISAGFLVFAACMYTRTWFSPDMDMRFVMVPQFAQGLANALFFTPLIALAFSSLKPEQMAGAASLFNFVRTLFGAIGASVAMTLWERREAVHHVRLTEHVDPYSPLARESLELLQRLGMDAQQSLGYLAGQITRQGFILSANDIYWLCAIAFAGMSAVVWLARPVKRG